MKQSHDFPLHARLQIDEHVATGDEIEPRKRSIARQVLGREHRQIAEPAADLIVPVLGLDEELSQALRRDVGADVLGIDSAARLRDCLRIDVGAKELDLNGAVVRVEEFEQAHADRVGLLPRGAAGHPDAHRIAGGLLREDAVKDVVRQDNERLFVPEERSDVDQQIAVQRRQLLRIALATLEIV